MLPATTVDFSEKVITRSRSVLTPPVIGYLTWEATRLNCKVFNKSYKERILGETYWIGICRPRAFQEAPWTNELFAPFAFPNYETFVTKDERAVVLAADSEDSSLMACCTPLSRVISYCRNIDVTVLTSSFLIVKLLAAVTAFRVVALFVAFLSLSFLLIGSKERADDRVGTGSEDVVETIIT
jgi:hypothetical protein